MTSEEILRRLTIGDRAFVLTLVSAASMEAPHALDARSVAFLRLGASIAAGSVGSVWQQRVGDGLDAGLTFDEVVAALLVLAPTVGTERVMVIAPEMARALGYDVDAALERIQDEAVPTTYA